MLFRKRRRTEIKRQNGSRLRQYVTINSNAFTMMSSMGDCSNSFQCLIGNTIQVKEETHIHRTARIPGKVGNNARIPS